MSRDDIRSLVIEAITDTEKLTEVVDKLYKESQKKAKELKIKKP